MKEERKRLGRLKRLEKIRAIAKQTAAVEAAQAESTLTQLRALSERTRRMASDYASRREASDGAALHQLGRFVTGLQAISRIADAKQRELAAAERRRAAIEERAELQARLIAKASEQPVLGSRKGSGTGLE